MIEQTVNKVSMAAIALIIGIVLSSAACSQTASKSQLNSDAYFDSLIYQHTSVATNPISQYTFTVDKSAAKIVVKKADKITDQASVEITEKQFAEIVEAFKKGKVKKNTKSAEDNCEGGSIEELTLSKDSKQILNGTIRNCDASGTLTGETGDLRDKLKSLFPEMEALRYF